MFGWTSLQSRRKIARLVMLYKIKHGLANVTFGKVLTGENTKLRAATTRDRRNHSQQLTRLQCVRDYPLNSFLSRTIQEWNNNLTEAAVTAETLDLFRTRVTSLIKFFFCACLPLLKCQSNRLDDCGHSTDDDDDDESVF